MSNGKSVKPPATPQAAWRAVNQAVEAKIDGARIQVHRKGDEVRIFTRNLNDVTDRNRRESEIQTSRRLEARARASAREVDRIAHLGRAAVGARARQTRPAALLDLL